MAENPNNSAEEKIPIARGPISSPPSYSTISTQPPAPGAIQCPYPNLLAPPGDVVAQQPTNTELIEQRNEWMSVPEQVPCCPPGLEYLTTLDHIFVAQKISLTEAFLGFERNNKYIIKNNLGQNVYMAVEDTDCCTRNFCGNCRPFDMRVLDLYNNEIIHFYRPLACTGCCFPCCLQSIEVTSPPGQVIGRVTEKWTCWYSNFSIKNHMDETVLRIEGPCCNWSCCKDINFKIIDISGNEIGRISKKWSGFAREYFTDADNFGISFPIDLDVRMKATLVGACMLIDMMFFENNQGNQ